VIANLTKSERRAGLIILLVMFVLVSVVRVFGTTGGVS
jgi:hypothetical protein